MINLNEELDFLELCDKDPIKANSILKNVSLINNWDLINLKSIPSVIYLEKSLKSEHFNKLISVEGTVIKTYPVLFKKIIGKLMCLKCNNNEDLKEDEMIKNTEICPSCGSRNIKINEDLNKAVPIQKIKIQNVGSVNLISETLEIVLEDKYANFLTVGNKVLITGIVKKRYKYLKPNEQIKLNLFIKAIKIEKKDQNLINQKEIDSCIINLIKLNNFEKRNILISSFSNNLIGLNNVKLGFLISLSCSLKKNERSSCHLLLIGDSGTGKSQLLKNALNLISPAILVNGSRVSDAGLTSCAVKQGKDWCLEAGALVLSDKGICCIDEFNNLKLNEKSGLLETMEQQTLSIAKAGIVTTLKTRSSIFAAVTTKHNYNNNKPVSKNINLSTPLVSRFDLIFGLFDDKNIDLEIEKAKRILFNKKSNENWTFSTLKTYLSFCRKKDNLISQELKNILMKYYTKKRELDGNNEYNTIRMLQSLIRITEAHSKLMNNDEVTEEDVYISIILMESTLSSFNKINYIDFNKVFIDKEIYDDAVKKIINKYLL